MPPGYVPPSWLSPTADWVGIVGFVIALAAFVVAYRQITSARQAAERAELAARTARSTLLRHDSVAELAAALRNLAEITRLHRDRAWSELPERYSTVRAALVAIKAAGSDVLLPKHKRVLQSAITQIVLMQDSIDAHLAVPQEEHREEPNPAELNRVVRKQSDSLVVVLSQLKAGSGENDY